MTKKAQGIPVFLTADRQSILMVGSGEAIMAKIALIAPYGAQLTLVGDGITAALKRAGLDEMVAGADLFDRAFALSDLDGKSAVYASTDDDAEERLIAKEARARGIPVNIVDRPALGSFITPAQFSRGPLQVAYSSGGAAPVFVRRLRALLEKMVPPALGTLASAAGGVRDELKAAIPDTTRRRLFWDRLFDRAGDFADLTETEAADQLLSHAHSYADEEREAVGQVQLVGAGPGDPDLLTIKAHRALGQADVIVYDRLVSREIIALARRDAELIYVGKKEGEHGVGQDGINDILVREASAGRRVVRLKSGDPLMFARAGEELDALRAEGIRTEVIPGITAMAGIAAAAQLPMTDRRYSSSVTLVTGHCADGAYSDWARLAGVGQTLAVYMGIRSAGRISEGLIHEGVSASTPVAIVENGTRADERRFFATLATLPQVVKSHRVKSPALLVIGDVVQVAVDYPDQLDTVVGVLSA